MSSTLCSPPSLSEAMDTKVGQQEESFTSIDGGDCFTYAPFVRLSPYQRLAPPPSTVIPSSPWLPVKVSNQDAASIAIDPIMSMIGLKEVKDQILMIRDKNDIAWRQGIDPRKECFNVAMLGNPGTGRFTSTRHMS